MCCNTLGFLELNRHMLYECWRKHSALLNGFSSRIREPYIHIPFPQLLCARIILPVFIPHVFICVVVI